MKEIFVCVTEDTLIDQPEWLEPERSTMTRKDFKLIAEVLRKTREELLTSTTPDHARAIDRVTEEFADTLKQTNPLFKKDTFMRAAGFSQG